MGIDIAKAALIEVDIQNDFCPAYTAKDGTVRPEGALAVRGGDRVIKPLNRIAQRFVEEGGKVIASQDWHPAHHSSFASSHSGKKVNDIIVLPVPEPPASPAHRRAGEAEFIPTAIQQVLWPDHCVQNTSGAAFHDEFNLNCVNLVIRKGFRKNLDSYSVFFENDRHTPTGLDGYLKGLEIKFVFIGGLATDYCVLYSVMDALRLGYKIVVLEDAVCGVDVPSGSIHRALDLMLTAGAVFMETEEIG
ncbi:MAG: isochorismatase family protein [Treponema sp.]|jgi:nicotinamidase/pyrazinamidase|nr:isochorismatase family protein [Treponema sp.]